MKSAQHPSLGFQLTLAARLYRTRLARALGEIGLFPGQEQVLMALGGVGDGLVMGELARALQVKPPTLTKTIQRLQSQELILRLAQQGDARVVHLVLTEAGRERLAQVREAEQAIEAELSALFRTRAEKRLRKSLKRLARHLSDPAGAATADDDDNDEDDA